MLNTKPVTLRDKVPVDFFVEFLDTPAAKHLGRKVISEHGSNLWPGPQKHICAWWKLEGGFAVGWNENPARGWSFPVVRIT